MSVEGEKGRLPGFWEMLMHPGQIRAEISALRSELAAARGAQAEAREIMLVKDREHRKELIEANDRYVTLRQRHEEAEKRLEELRRETDALTMKLEERVEVEQTVAAFDARLGEFEKIKKNLELKIETLKKQLEEARRRLRESLVKDGLTDELADGISSRGLTERGAIDMRSRQKRGQRPTKDPDNWFKTLPEV